MNILAILKMAAAGVTALIGVALIAAPWRVQGFTGLEVENPRGITEMRAAMGGFYLGAGLAPLLFAAQAQPMYLLLGLTYAIVALVRLVGMFVDRSVTSSNVISLVSEAVLAAVLLV